MLLDPKGPARIEVVELLFFRGQFGSPPKVIHENANNDKRVGAEDQIPLRSFAFHHQLYELGSEIRHISTQPFNVNFGYWHSCFYGSIHCGTLLIPAGTV
jgi:hypothetical protein